MWVWAGSGLAETLSHQSPSDSRRYGTGTVLNRDVKNKSTSKCEKRKAAGEGYSTSCVYSSGRSRSSRGVGDMLSSTGEVYGADIVSSASIVMDYKLYVS